MKADHLAKEAERLLKDEVLVYAIGTMRQEALAALVRANANEPIEVLRAQQRVEACDEILSVLSTYVENGKTPDRRPVA